MTVGEIRVDPHPISHQKGIGAKNLKRDDIGTSFQINPNGVVKPTNEKWPALQVTAATTEKLGEDAVCLDPDYCENYASGRSNASKTSEDKHREGKGKGKGKGNASSSLLSAGGGSSGWEWDKKVQMKRRWAEDLKAYVFWDERAQAEKYWDIREWKWVE